MQFVFFTLIAAALEELTDMKLMGVPMLHSVILGVAELRSLLGIGTIICVYSYSIVLLEC